MENISDTNTILFIVVAVVAGAGACAYMYYANKKRKDSSWSGTVIDKDIKESVHQSDYRNRDSDSKGITFSFGGNNNQGSATVTHSYYITVRPDSTGEEIKWEVSDGFYQTVNIGDKLTKRPGTLTPEITEKAATQSQPVVPSGQLQDSSSSVPPVFPPTSGTI